MQRMIFISSLVSCFVGLASGFQGEEKAFLKSELVFPPEHWHNHGSCIVECPNGDLLTCWYNGSGERRADDVKVEGARLASGAASDSRVWSQRFLMADTPGFPDTNPCMFIDPQNRLWLLWQAIIANEWHTALFKYKISSNYQNDGPPKWETSETLILKPGPEFLETVKQQTQADLARFKDTGLGDRFRAYTEGREKRAADKYFSRMGWMTRAHPFVLDGKRLIVPLYSDGYSFSIMALSDDWGANWKASAPLVGPGNVQPSIVKKKDGTLVTYMRDNGPPPKRLQMSESKDNGLTWGSVTDADIPNPGAGAEVLGLRSGRWALINNDTERGRHSLAVWLSDDEGQTWKWKRRLEYDSAGNDAKTREEATTAGYPSIIQAKDGTLHASYTFTLKRKDGPRGECIKHAHFNEAWVMAGE